MILHRRCDELQAEGYAPLLHKVHAPSSLLPMLFNRYVLEHCSIGTGRARTLVVTVTRKSGSNTMFHHNEFSSEDMGDEQKLMAAWERQTGFHSLTDVTNTARPYASHLEMHPGHKLGGSKKSSKVDPRAAAAAAAEARAAKAMAMQRGIAMQAARAAPRGMVHCSPKGGGSMQPKEGSDFRSEYPIESKPRWMCATHVVGTFAMILPSWARGARSQHVFRNIFGVRCVGKTVKRTPLAAPAWGY